MATFKECLTEDLSVFVNSLEFAEEHMIEGHSIMCSLDSDVLQERAGADELGMNEKNIRIFAKTEELANEELQELGFGAHLNVDGAEYVVQSWSDNFGMTEIVLSANLMN